MQIQTAIGRLLEVKLGTHTLPPAPRQLRREPELSPPAPTRLLVLARPLVRVKPPLAALGLLRVVDVDAYARRARFSLSVFARDRDASGGGLGLRRARLRKRRGPCSGSRSPSPLPRCGARACGSPSYGARSLRFTQLWLSFLGVAELWLPLMWFAARLVFVFVVAVWSALWWGMWVCLVELRARARRPFLVQRAVARVGAPLRLPLRRVEPLARRVTTLAPLPLVRRVEPLALAPLDTLRRPARNARRLRVASLAS
ncbi:hypothetical protein FIBSPDRAFT_963294 [Athelia psychrophila]|uniref:Uncharacterized protein n=1 Tax=Athelia psychrophila TaxID=1759441 RepID=A0A165Z3Y5_9AGAM|nr:hypothetical protein FIBSPDRAFT_963294 [Fibularhizoctonia sp. CBS 109695]